MALALVSAVAVAQALALALALAKPMLDRGEASKKGDNLERVKCSCIHCKPPHYTRARALSVD